MTTAAEPRRSAPTGLGARGRAFWRKVQKTYDLDLPETELLVEVCRALDQCELLHTQVERDGASVTGSRGQVVAHPLLLELRSTRQLVGRLLAQLGLPSEDGEALLTPRQTRARKAAQVRWGLPAGRRGTA